MKLIVTFADEDSFSFRDDTICLRVSNLNRLQDVINNSELRQDFIDGNRILLEAAYDDTLIDEVYQVKNMPYFEDFSGFESIKIALNKGVSVEQVRDFFKSFPYKTIIDTDDMDLTDVYRFCTLDYAATPMIKNIYNTEVVSVNEMKESLEVVFDFAKKLDDGKLSPLEKLMFLYDYLKTRIYKEDKNYSNSASLSRVTLGESIVCLGYSNLFSAIANLIGISTYVKTYINMLNKYDGHATVVSYINDDKYNFHSFLEFDPTWDSRNSEKDIGFVSKYYWFGLSPVFSERCKKVSALSAVGRSASGGNLLRSFNNCTQLIKLGASKDIKISKRMFGTLFERLEEEFTKLGYNEGLVLLRDIAAKDNITKYDIDLLHLTYLKLFENNLGYDEFLRLLYFVRRSQFVYGADYELDFEDVVRVARRRETRANFIAYILFNDRDEYKNVTSLREFKTMPKGTKDKLQYDKERLELVKTLRRINEGRNK